MGNACFLISYPLISCALIHFEAMVAFIVNGIKNCIAICYLINAVKEKQIYVIEGV
jgi:hypothetical protein